MPSFLTEYPVRLWAAKLVVIVAGTLLLVGLSL